MKTLLIILIGLVAIPLIGQSQLERKETQKSNDNEVQIDGYVNSYFNKRSSFIDKYSKEISKKEQQELDLIVNNIKNNAPKSSDYFYIEYINQGSTIDAFPLLEKASDLYPNNAAYYDDFVYHYELANDKNQRVNYSKKLYESNTIHEAILEYNYNVLMSLDKDAIIITNGSDDTYPLFIWQDVFNVRPDVCVINIDMLSEEAFIKTKKSLKKLDLVQQSTTIKTVNYLIDNNPDKKIYVGHTINQKILEKYQSNLYLSGLTYQYSVQGLNNVKSAVDRYENSFKTEQLYRPSTSSEINRLNFNYILPLVTFLEYYNSEEKKGKYRKTKELILSIAKRANKETFIIEYLDSLNL
jgi:hypothetical protein